MEELLNRFRPITLDEMNGIKLMNRTDTKFLTDMDKLRMLLELARRDYRIQVVSDVRNIPYSTVYFDTEDMDMFMAHQNGIAKRQKVRIRSYVNSDLDFLEVKSKDNHGRTRKKRIALNEFDPQCPDEVMDTHDTQGCHQFLAGLLRYRPESLHVQLGNQFKRITLVNNDKTERLTIDTELQFYNWKNKIHLGLDNIAVIELKRDGLQYSPILEMLRQLRIKPHGFSKYCMGEALTDDCLKQNQFKGKLHEIQRINAVPIIRTRSSFNKI